MSVDPAGLRQLAEAAYSNEHRPAPCTICDLADEAKRAADDLVRLRDALAFYADPSLWESTDERGITRGSGWRAREDGGAVARAACSTEGTDDAAR